MVPSSLCTTSHLHIVTHKLVSQEKYTLPPLQNFHSLAQVSTVNNKDCMRIMYSAQCTPAPYSKKQTNKQTNKTRQTRKDRAVIKSTVYASLINPTPHLACTQRPICQELTMHPCPNVHTSNEIFSKLANPSPLPCTWFCCVSVFSKRRMR